MGSVTMLEPLYTSAPIVDYDEELDIGPETEDMLDAPGVMTLAPEAFDAAILEALVSP
jgi:hypothetical protein